MIDNKTDDSYNPKPTKKLDKAIAERITKKPYLIYEAFAILADMEAFRIDVDCETSYCDPTGELRRRYERANEMLDECMSIVVKHLIGTSKEMFDEFMPIIVKQLIGTSKKEITNMEEEIKHGYQPSVVYDENGNPVQTATEPPSGGSAMQDE